MEGATSHNLLRVVAVCLLATTGCSLVSQRTVWHQPSFASPDVVDWECRSPGIVEECYAAAIRAEADGCPSCVDYYYQTAVECWPWVEQEIAACGEVPTRHADLYRSAIAKLLITAQRFGRWDPCRGLTVATSGGPVLLPTRYEGFVWGPENFQLLAPCGTYDDPKLSRQFRNGGLGIPLVAVRHKANPQPFTLKSMTFAATAVLRPGSDSTCPGFQLEFYDPLRVSSTCVAGRQVLLARDISAPFAYADQGVDREWLRNFLWPGTASTRDGLFMLEPYQRGKIPVVFVHGLLSDAKTWVGLANELRAHPNLNDRFQWWGYHYASGEPFLESAAVLRRQLRQIRCTYDPMRSDPAFSQIVLIGHSMGGLVAKLLVTESSDQLWNSVARQPLQSVRTTEETRRYLQEAFFFRPSPDVTRVVFAGTPHLGSDWARRPIGRLGSALVRTSASREAQYQQLVRDNPNLFREEVRRRLPTSIDLLEPSSRLLKSTAALPYSPCVSLHTIVGLGRPSWTGQPSDGVVPAYSARLRGVLSERDVDAIHTEINSNPDSIEEIECILREHLRQHAMHGTSVRW